MQTTRVLALSSILTAAILVALPVGAVDLNGGTATFTFPEDIGNNRASISVTNNTKTLICDFVVRVVDSSSESAKAPPFQIEEITLDDPNQTGEDWSVDDNDDGDVDDANENDDLPTSASEKVRIQEEGNDHCLGRGRSGSLEIRFDQNPRKGDKIKISPTSASGGVIFVSSLPAGCATVAENDVLFPTGDYGLTNGTGEPVTSFPVSSSFGTEVVDMHSPTHGGHYDFFSRRYYTDRPFYPEEELQLQYELSGFNPDGGATNLCVGKHADAIPVDVATAGVERR